MHTATLPNTSNPSKPPEGRNTKPSCRQLVALLPDLPETFTPQPRPGDRGGKLTGTLDVSKDAC